MNNNGASALTEYLTTNNKIGILDRAFSLIHEELPEVERKWFEGYQAKYRASEKMINFLRTECPGIPGPAWMQLLDKINDRLETMLMMHWNTPNYFN